MKRPAAVLVSLSVLASLLTALAVTSPVTAVPAPTLEAASDAPLNEHTSRPKTGLFFNNPTAGGNPNVKRLLIDRFNGTPPGAEVRLMTWNVDSDGNAIVDAVRSAVGRGVTVKIITSQANCGAAEAAFDLPWYMPLWVHCVDGGANGRGMHMKMVTFSETGKNAAGEYDPVPYVTLVGSGNLTTGGWTNQWNDMFQYANRADVYSWYADRFDLINTNRGNPDVVKYHFETDGDRARANFMPIDDGTPVKEQDPVWDRLDNIPANSSTVIRVAMFASDIERGQWLVNKLKSMRANGADIRFIAGPDVRASLRSDLLHADIPVVNGWRGDCTPETNPDCEFVHLKMMTAKYWQGGVWNYRSYTGSENWNWDGLTRNFEVTQRIGGDGVHENYNILFDRIWNAYS